MREIPFDPQILVDLAALEYDEADEDYQELLDRIRAEVESLPEPERDIMEMMVWGRMSQREVGEALGLHRGTVRARTRRGKAMLRERLGDLL